MLLDVGVLNNDNNGVCSLGYIVGTDVIPIFNVYVYQYLSTLTQSGQNK